jgi:hypothetical protein
MENEIGYGGLQPEFADCTVQIRTDSPRSVASMFQAKMPPKRHDSN